MSKKISKKQALRIATIYNKSVTPKSVLRAQSEDAITAFLRRGGVIEQCKPSRRKSTTKMSSKSSRGFVSGTSGFANGYPKKSVGA